MKRRLPRVAELRPIVKFRAPGLRRRSAQVAAAHTIDDLRRLSRRRAPRAVFDFADGAAEREISLDRARKAYSDLQFNPVVLQDVTHVDVSHSLLGRMSSAPFAIAPIGFTRLMHSAGESAGLRAASRFGVPFTLSTMGTTAIEDLRAVAPAARLWFQLYLWSDRERSEDLVKRAANSGYETLLVTVDTPVAGARMRDVRNGFTIPPSLTVRTCVDTLTKPAWWFDLLTTDPLAFASLDRWPGTVAELLETMFDPSITDADVRWLRDIWPGKLLVKGVQRASEAVKLAEMGVDGVVLSSHGGRQLDRVAPPLHLVPEVRARVGQAFTVLVDTGVLDGGDIVAAMACGADGVLVGRAYLYGLMAAGELGAQRALDILGRDMRRVMALLGVTRIADLDSTHVTLHPPGVMGK